MSRMNRSRRRTAGTIEYRRLLEIAEVLDVVSQRRTELYPDAVTDDTALRIVLFALLDQPTQERWEKVREVEVFPSYLPGLEAPAPLGVTLGDLVYAGGLHDVDCPSRAALLQVLRWACAERDVPFSR